MAIKLLWTIVGLALACVFFAVLTAIDAAVGGGEEAQDATFGFLLFAALLGLPSGVLLHRARSALKHKKLVNMIEGYVASRDSISPYRLSVAIQRSELEAEALLLELIEAGRFDLVFHRSREEYLHRGRIHDVHEFLERCDSCGARLRAQVVFPGERISCEFCNAPLKTRA